MSETPKYELVLRSWNLKDFTPEEEEKWRKSFSEAVISPNGMSGAEYLDKNKTNMMLNPELARTQAREHNGRTLVFLLGLQPIADESSL